MSTDRFDTLSGAASGKFHVEPAAASATSGATCMSTDRFDTPSGAASGKFHVEPAAASATSGETCRNGWHERK